ncbi:hypothetical protein [Streptomyces sp. NPDC089799]|uniref:hypothetical protein n=1 Tax=Streptomyces sp. NPDC089799 TaxID=3155066 RepID=UPI00341C21EF
MNKTLAAAVKSLAVTVVAGTAVFASSGLAAADNGPWGAPKAAASQNVLLDNGPWGAPAGQAGLQDNGPW